MKTSSILRSALAAMMMVATASAIPQTALAQEPFVLVPDNPGGGGGGAARGNAVTTANVNVRQGPGTNHRVVDVLQRGTSVSIRRCQANWCLVDHRGPSGWVSRNYLREVIDTGRPIRPGRPGGIGGGADRLVCFFESANFRGANFCARPGESERSLGSWGRRLMSVRVDGRTSVEICARTNFRDCTTFRRDVPMLDRHLRNNVGSFLVR